MAYDGNQLKKISDEYGSQNKYNVKEYNDLANLGTEFLYDANGNMIADYDREIVTIRYNLLNLPDTIQFKNGNQIINRYAADGSKLRTDYFTLVTPVVVPLGNVCKWNYEVDVINQNTRMFADNFEYTLWKDPDIDAISLSRINNSEGYTTCGLNPKVSYYYYRKDHLGNNREVWRANDKKTLQRTQYYPSGLPWAECENAEAQPYKYNGKEFIEMHGYDTYDYGWRGLQAAIMRFNTRDPLCEKYYSISPYAYCLNNPVRFTDPDGREVRIKGDEKYRKETFNNLQQLSSSKLILLKNGKVVEASSYKGKSSQIYLTGAVTGNGKDKVNGTALVHDVISDKHTATIQKADNNPNEPGRNAFIPKNYNSTIKGVGSSGDLYFDNSSTGRVSTGALNADGYTTTQSDQSALGHELLHARHSFQGTVINRNISVIDPDNQINDKLSVEEIRTRRMEDYLRSEQGDQPRAQPTINNQ